MEAPTANGDAGGGAFPPVGPDPLAGRPQHPIDGTVRCAVCRRFPLVGEQVTRHAGRGESEWSCATCESAGHGDRLGAVTGSARVRSLGGAANVQRAA